MKIQEYFIKPDEVYYVYQELPSVYDNSKIVKTPYLRIENVNGKLYETVLPIIFLVEDDSKVVFLQNGYNTRFSPINSCEDIIIQKKDPNSIPVTFHIIKDLHCKELNQNQYQDYISTLLCSKKDYSKDYNLVGYFTDIVLNALEYLNIDEDFLYDYDPNDVNQIILEQMARKRRHRIENNKQNENI